MSPLEAKEIVHTGSYPIKEHRRLVESTSVFVPELTDAHITGIEALEAYTDGLLNEPTGTYGDRLTPDDIRAWIKDMEGSHQFMLFRKKESPRESVEGWVYLPPAEEAHIKAINDGALDTFQSDNPVRIPEDVRTLDLSFVHTPEVTNEQTTSAIRQTIRKIQNDTEGKIPPYVLYFETPATETTTSSLGLESIGFRFIGKLNYDNPARTDNLDNVFLLTPTT